MSRIFRNVSQKFQKSCWNCSNNSLKLLKQGRWASLSSVAQESSIDIKKTPSGKPYFVRNAPPAYQGEFIEPTVQELLHTDEALKHPDYFQVHKLFTVKDLFDARVHLGHKKGSMDPKMADFVFGTRFETCIIDLDKTAFHLRQALNFVAHVAFRKGIIMWVTRSPQTMHLVETTAIECGEYAHCREWDIHTLTNSTRKFGGITRLPDVILMLNTLDTVMAPHGAIKDGAKMLIPTVGIVDTNCDPTAISYPVPGNDDSLQSIQLYCKLFKEAIIRGKNKRKQIDNLKQHDNNNDTT